MALLTNINGKFSVSDVGAVTFNNAFTFPTTDGAANYVLQTNGSGQLAWALNGNGDISGSGTANTVTKFTGAKTIGDGPITFSGNNSTFTGNVGIGTTSLSAKLMIETGSDEGIRIYRSGANANFGAIEFRNNDDSATNSRIGFNANEMRLEATNQFRFVTNSSDRMFINSIGNIGIGTTSPSAPLHISNTYPVIRLTDSDGTAPYAQIINSSGILQLRADDGNSTANSSMQFFVDGTERLTINSSGNATFTGTISSGAITAPTFSGDLNGTINTVTTATTKGNSTNDTTVATTAFVQNVIGTIPAGLVFQGTWNADTNSPTLTSGSGTTGHFYIVSVAGSTNLDGITDWQVGDWAVFIEQGASDQWEKIDNSSVLGGSGIGGSFAGWSGSGTSVTLGNAPVTFSGNDSTFAGNVTVGDNTTNVDLYLKGGTDSNTSINFGDPSDNNVGQIIYRHANNSMSFDTNDIERMRIDSSGNVGIKNTSPSDFLSWQQQLVVGNGSSDAGITIYHGSGSGNQGAIVFADGNTGTDRYRGSISYNGADEMKFFTSTSERMRISANGNVGIGTSNIGTQSNLYLGAASSSEGGQITLQKATGGTLAAHIDAYTSGSIDYMRVLSGTDTATTGAPFVFDLTNTRLGIGDTTPEATLTVKKGSEGAYFSAGGDTANGRQLVFTSSNGNGSNGAKHQINATSSNGIISLATANVDRLTVGNTGNVGIGTTSPIGKLNINTGLTGITYDMVNQANGSISFGNNSGGTAVPTITGKSNNNLGLMLVSGTNDTGPVADMYFDVRENDNTDYSTLTSSAYRFNRAGNPLMTILRSGNVGIGTTNPSAKIDLVGGDVTGGLKISADKVTSAFFAFGADANETRITSTSYGGYKPLTIHTGGSERMRIDSAGNVGIGTTNPKAKFDVNGHFCVDSKSHAITNAFTTCLTVNLDSHTGCYVTLTCFGDWGSHSSAAYRGEFFLQNGANGYAEPGIILRQDDNTSNGTDQIVCQIVDPAGSGNPKDFEIQIRTTATTGTTSFTGQLTYTVQGQFNSIT